MEKYLQQAYEAWCAGAELRRRRKRYKEFTYGRQWSDKIESPDGTMISEAEAAIVNGSRPSTNNIIRQLVKCVTGNFRSRLLEGELSDTGTPLPEELTRRNSLTELDCRILEEYLISGCAIQRVTTEQRMAGGGVWVDNVSPDRFFVNRFSDPRGLDIELVGMLHDYSLRELQMRYGISGFRKASELARIYAEIDSCGTDGSIGDECHSEFFNGATGRCRVIEVWTLESRSVVKCHDPLTGRVFLSPQSRRTQIDALNRRRRKAGVEEVSASERITARWHCRHFAPDGTLLDEYDSPYGHNMHPFAVKFYPLTDGEVHSFVEDIIDQQKHVNRLITVIDHIMSSSAKGVLLFPTDCKPKGISWTEIAQRWAMPNGIIPIEPGMRSSEPHQITCGTEPAGAYKLLNLELDLLKQVSGVSNALQGHLDSGNVSATLYQTQVRNSAVSILDLLESFNDFRSKRNILIKQC